MFTLSTNETILSFWKFFTCCAVVYILTDIIVFLFACLTMMRKRKLVEFDLSDISSDTDSSSVCSEDSDSSSVGEFEDFSDDDVAGPTAFNSCPGPSSTNIVTVQKKNKIYQNKKLDLLLNRDNLR
ncbi:Uncharacterised protein at_DN1210 [Pycnogonum litorale]